MYDIAHIEYVNAKAAGLLDGETEREFKDRYYREERMAKNRDNARIISAVAIAIILIGSFVSVLFW
jgi:hypothetical protein